jgi:leader peptidase (prepilin peptidase)/N-methyltransferase
MAPELTRPLALIAGAGASFAAALQFNASGRTVAAVFFLSVLAVLSAIDVEERRIPNRIVLPAAAVMLALQIALEPGRALEWTAAALGASALLLVLARLNPAGLGLGDVKLALLLGAALGGGVLAALALGSLLAGLWGLGLVLRHGLAARRATVPFAPFLAVGAAAVLLVS